MMFVSLPRPTFSSHECMNNCCRIQALLAPQQIEEETHIRFLYPIPGCTQKSHTPYIIHQRHLTDFCLYISCFVSSIYHFSISCLYHMLSYGYILLLLKSSLSGGEYLFTLDYFISFIL